MCACVRVWGEGGLSVWREGMASLFSESVGEGIQVWLIIFIGVFIAHVHLFMHGSRVLISFPTNDSGCHHGLPCTYKNLYGGLILGVNTLYRVFCFFKLFAIIYGW